MQDHHGVFLVIEGSDGSGKSTQFRLTVERLRAVGHEVEVFKFPQHGESSSYFVNSYLSGEYGPATQVSPYTASLFYALDRYHASSKIREALLSGKVVIADRYVGSNMAHQGSKFTNVAEQRGFFIWEDNLEFELLGIPRPNLNIYLRVPVEISVKLMGSRQKLGYTDKKIDQHEADLEYLQKTVATYDLLCKLFPKDFKEINCTQAGQLLSIVEINNRIWQIIKPLLPKPKHQPKGAVLSLGETTQISKHSTNPKNDIKFYVPAGLSGRLRSVYIKYLSEISKLQQKMQAKASLSKEIDVGELQEALRLVTPLAAQSSDMKDLLSLGTTSAKVSKFTPGDEPTPVNAIIEQMSESLSSPKIDGDDDVKLLEAAPRNEFQLLGGAKIDALTYQQKEHELKKELAKNMDKIVYRFEVTSHYATLKQLRGSKLAKDMKIMQPAAPRGYTLPAVIEAAVLEELFNRCFDLSRELFNKLVAQGQQDLAIHSLLFGHKVRWQFSTNAAQLLRALRATSNRQHRVFLELLIDKVAEAHPHVAKVLSQPKTAKR